MTACHLCLLLFFYGILNFKTGELNYVNGGHNPPYIVGRNGELKAMELTNGLALGAFEGFDYKNKIIKLDEGDTVFLFTDGVTEAMDVNFEQYTRSPA